MQQDVGGLELDHHLLGVGDEVGREIAAIELHALDHLELGGHALGFLDGDHAFLADALHGLGDDVADLTLAVGRNAADLGDLGARGDAAAALAYVVDDGTDGQIDAALEIHRVHARGHRLVAFAHDRLGQHGGRGGAVAGLVRGPAGHFAQHLGAHVLELVGQFDLLGHGDAVLGDARRPEGLVEHHVAALGAERHLDRIGQDVDALEQAIACLGIEFYFFGCHLSLSP